MDLFLQLSLVIVVAAVISGILHKLKQPLIIGHIITGLLIGPALFNNPSIKEIVDTLSQVGIALLLFLIGLNLTPKVIKEVGKVSLLASLGQIVVTASAGFLISFYLKYSIITSLYIAVALTFSSTIIILKLLSDKHDLAKLYSKISIGVLLIQDLVVAIILIGLAGFGRSGFDLRLMILTLIKGVVLVDLILLFSVYVMPKLTAMFAKSQEFLFLFSVGWGLGLASLFHWLGFSVVVGALAAGVVLSVSPYHFEISSRLRPLRDFFIILFFILIGSRINIGSLRANVVPIIVLTLFVVILKPVIVTFLTGVMGYRKRVSFLTGLNFSQISEFSLILVMLGINLGHLDGSLISVITVVALLSIATSTYLVLFGNKIYPLFQKLVYERKGNKQIVEDKEIFDVILFGCNRVGYDFIETFRHLKEKFLVVDFDPEVIDNLKNDKINCRYGDADDNEFLEELSLDKVKMVISTIPDFETNQFLISKIKQNNKHSVIIAISHNVDEAVSLYESGATYVITPHFLGGKYATMLIAKYGFEVDKFATERDRHLKDLSKRKELGHDHPLPEVFR